MSTERKGVEFFVGLFLLIGFGVIAGLVITFGRAGQGMENLYHVRVRFPNASGLIKGSDVLLSGARIGSISKAPALTGERYEVEVELGIRDEVRIPRKATFQIRASGMLGDSYVDVTVPADFDPKDLAQPGELISGQRTAGFDELTSKGSEMIDTLNREILRKLSTELDEINVATRNINEELLTRKNMGNLEDTLANMKMATDDFSKASRNLELTLAKTEEVVDTARTTLQTVNAAGGDLRLAIGDIRKVADSSRLLLNKASNGEGTLGMLISDKQTADNLRALIVNLRKSGVLFYKDHAPSAPEAATGGLQPRPKRN